jgi:3-deoxy-7-phosphoheptulonate synthase
MIVFLDSHISQSNLDELIRFLKSHGIVYEEIQHQESHFLYLSAGISELQTEDIERFPGVDQVTNSVDEHPAVSSLKDSFSIKINNRVISKKHFFLIAGPCTIESEEQLDKIAISLKQSGINFLRGGTFKLRTSPYSFAGLGINGVEILANVATRHKMISITEVTEISQIEYVSSKIDILQVGTRNMLNYPLLQELGKINNPIILKRGMSSSIHEWLLAAEYIVKAGNPNVILCERGIRTFENYTRNTLDISAISAVKNLCNLPIIVDPSHSTGRADMIKSVSWAAIAGGADGLIVETHYDPTEAICDAPQHIDIDLLKQIVKPLPNLLKLWNKQQS